jgi:Ca-activated chloride channel homolog
MKKIFSVLLLVLVCTFAATVFAQTRPRRVGTQGGSQPSPVPANPSQAPILRGNNRSAGQRPSTPSRPTQQEPEEVEAGDVIRVNTTLVTIPLSVTDRNGRYIPNLTKEDFRLWENGIEQSVAYFSSVDKPFSVVLMIDTSGSTRFRLEDIQDAAIEFVNQLRSDDRVMVVSFDDDVRVLSEFTSNRFQLQNAIRETRTGQGTRLYDAVDLVINQRLNQISGRKAIVLFTDGVDTTSRRASYESNVEDAEELDALIYPVQYDTEADMRGNGGGGVSWPRTPNIGDIIGQIWGRGRRGRRGGGGGVGTSPQDYGLADRYLRDLAEKTGARQYNADTTQNLAYAFSNIAEELRRQYSLGYYPKSQAQAGERRQIQVRVNRPNLAVRTRDSYVYGGPGTLADRDDSMPGSPPVLRRKFSDETNWENANR